LETGAALKVTSQKFRVPQKV